MCRPSQTPCLGGFLNQGFCTTKVTRLASRQKNWRGYGAGFTNESGRAMGTTCMCDGRPRNELRARMPKAATLNDAPEGSNPGPNRNAPRWVQIGDPAAAVLFPFNEHSDVASSGISLLSTCAEARRFPPMLHPACCCPQQTRVKLNRVFFPRWHTQDRSLGCRFTRRQLGTAEISVIHSCASIIG